jgi:hypothetical protein
MMMLLLILIYCFVCVLSDGKMTLGTPKGHLGQAKMRGGRFQGATLGVEKWGDEKYELHSYRLDEFPKDKISTHFPCVEGDIFATNCACHLRCQDKTCLKAKDLCYKYRHVGCKYVLFRGPPEKQIATLKRDPTEAELASYDIGAYPYSEELLNESSIWKEYIANKSSEKRQQGAVLGDFIKGPSVAGKAAAATVDALLAGSDSGGLCIETKQKDEKWKTDFLAGGIAVVALSYQTPKSLLNSMKSWKQSGLLDMAQERHAILNDPLPQELVIAAEHGFSIHQPKDFASLGRLDTGSLVQMSKPNVVTIGAAFGASMNLCTSKYVLFLEKDFKIDIELTKDEIHAQLIGAAGMLERGHDIIRLLSRKGKGCGTFKECGHGWHPSPLNNVDRKRNWYSFYCPGYVGSDPYVKDCLGAVSKTCDAAREQHEKKPSIGNMHASECVSSVPRYRCFTSWDSNWSVNAILVKRETMLNKRYMNSVTGKEVGPLAALGKSFWQKNDGFESSMANGIQWMNWKVPMCISFDGLFLHEEIETGA